MRIILDMDFKVAGSEVGVTALQMDIKTRELQRDYGRNCLKLGRPDLRFWAK